MTGALTAHYSFGGLRERIADALDKLGEPPTVANLGAVDEFHVGGRPATKYLVDQLGLSQGTNDRVLDIGSGLGGTARYIASTTAAKVTGVDLTPEYVEVATWLTDLVGLSAQVNFVHGSADELPAFADSFTAAAMVHVGMNIADKGSVFASIAECMQPTARFAIYDLMKTGDVEPDFPVPWAANATTSWLETPDSYQAHLEQAGFAIELVEDRTEAALVAFAPPAGGRSGPGDGPPPLGLHLVVGPETPKRLGNLGAAVRSGAIAPTLIVASKAS